MTDQEKLVELLNEVITQAERVEHTEREVRFTSVKLEEIADYLIAHGVTVRGMEEKHEQ